MGNQTTSCFILIAGAFFVFSTHALTCYENDKEKGVAIEVTNPKWKYCAFIPSNGIREPTVFGVGDSEDVTETYDKQFGQNDDMYKVLSVCLYEKYDLYPFRRHSLSTRPVEYLFRCVCNYDLCNAANNFPQFLQKQRDD